MENNSNKKVLAKNIKLYGTVEKIIYPSDHPHQSGEFAIFIAQVRDKENKDEATFDTQETLSGVVPELVRGQEYHIVADSIEHIKYGLQYEVRQMHSAVKWHDKSQVEKFLSYILPAKTISLLMTEVPDLMEVLDRGDIDRLVKVKGIGESRAERIISRYNDSIDKAAAYTKLSDLGLTVGMIDKLIKRYKSADIVVDKVLNYPYQLIYDVPGIGWNTADKWAIKAGIAPENPDRIKAYFYYQLCNILTTKGDTFVSKNALFETIFALSDRISNDLMIRCLKEAVAEGTIYYEPETERVGLMMARKLESDIANEIHRLMSAPVKPINHVDDVITACEKTMGFEYSDEQKAAIKVILDNNVSLLTAKAGSGKSASMFPVVSALLREGYNVEQCCLSGRAALNLSEATGIEGKTIHRLLHWNAGTNEFDYNESNPLKTNMVILDEVSMVGGKVFLSLLKAIPTGARLVMVGDFGQLEPIGVGNVGYDLMVSRIIPHAHLTKIFRQAQKSGIISESSKIYDGKQIIPANFTGSKTMGVLQDFTVTSCEDTQACYAKVITEFRHWTEDLHRSVDDIAICVAKRSIGPLCARLINDTVQKFIPLPGARSLTVKYKDGDTEYEVLFREGDKVTVTDNNYNIKNINNEPHPIFNGNVGKIVTINLINRSMIVKFGSEKVVIPSACLDHLRLGYVITTHKSQGIGIPYVIAVADPSARTLLSKELLYTQITRAKKECLLIGTTESIRYATTKTSTRTKKTWLTELIKNNS